MWVWVFFNVLLFFHVFLNVFLMCYCVQRAWKQGSKTARHNQGVGLLIQTHWRLMALRDRWYEWVMSLEQMRHVTDWMRHIFVNHVTLTNELFKHIGISWLSKIGDANESCSSNEWDTSHIFMNRFPITIESCHAYDWVLSHTYEWATQAHWSLMARRQEKQMSHVPGIAELWKVDETYI